MKRVRIIMVMLVLLGVASLAEAQIVVSQTTVSTTRVYEKSGREKGWVIRPELGFGFHIMNNGGFMIDPTITGVYQFNPYFSIGAGSGITYVNCNDYKNESLNDGMTSIPLYVNLRAYFCDRKWSPFFDFKVKYSFPIIVYYSLDNSSASMQGIAFQGTLGMQYKNFDFGFVFGGFNVYHTYHSYDGNMYFYNSVDIKLLLTFAYNFQLKKK